MVDVDAQRVGLGARRRELDHHAQAVVEAVVFAHQQGRHGLGTAEARRPWRLGDAHAGKTIRGLVRSRGIRLPADRHQRAQRGERTGIADALQRKHEAATEQSIRVRLRHRPHLPRADQGGRPLLGVERVAWFARASSRHRGDGVEYLRELALHLDIARPQALSPSTRAGRCRVRPAAPLLARLPSLLLAAPLLAHDPRA